MIRRRSPSLRRRLFAALFAFVLAGTNGCAMLSSPFGQGPSESETATPIRNVRQLTFAGRRSGEGYYSHDGRDIVFQSEREPGNPFYQIYRMHLETGETWRVSNGRGSTTCAWIHPDGETVLFASTHLDPDADAKQEKELEERAAGTARRYAWGFDPSYELFAARGDGSLDRLTNAFGYDAEGSFSPDGRWIAFASNRHAYAEALDAEEAERLAENPSSFIDLYLLDTRDGTTKRLTTTPGYDGGPFFSPDGERIVWRRFSEDGSRAEIHSMRRDGSDERILTHLGVMSWAPFYHPSGDYVVFTTNRHGFDNFELYLVDAEGRSDPVRVTTRAGFDGLPVFSPAGNELLWTSNLSASKQSQLFRADWDDDAARRLLGLTPVAEAPRPATQALPGQAVLPVDPGAIERHVRTLTDDRMQGRRAGSPGEAVAIDYLVGAMSEIGLEPAGGDGDYRSGFEFTAGVALGPDNELVLEDDSGASPPLVLDRDWRPLAFSRSGEIPASPVVFAGYGLVASSEDDGEAIDEYADLDVEGRWVLVFRDLPAKLGGSRRQHLQLYASLRHKAMIARDRGARGVLFVSGPQGRYQHDLIPLRFDASLAGTRIGVLSISDGVADRLLRSTGVDLAALQKASDERLLSAPSDQTVRPQVEIDGAMLAARIDLETLRAEGHNVLGRLRVGREASVETIVLGAHFDHLGHGEGSGSLASGEDVGRVHPGADDNASGVAVLLEIAELLVRERELGASLGQRDFIFAAWSGEELGLLGSDRWAEDQIDPHAAGGAPVVYLNFDMVGRLDKGVVVNGLGSSEQWATILERAAAPLRLSILPQQDSYLPTDSTSFYTRGIPILSAFTGVHSEYHTPRDTPDRLNYAGAAEIVTLFSRIANELSQALEPPAYVAIQAPSNTPGRTGFRVFLGTVPDYAQTDIVGVRLSGVAPAGPAEKGGIRGGDVIVEVDGRAIENLYDYTYALEALRVGEPARIVVLRGEERVSLEVVPASRD